MKRKKKKICFNLGFSNLPAPPSPTFPCQEKWVPLNKKQINNWEWDWAPGALRCHEGRGRSPVCCQPLCPPGQAAFNTQVPSLYYLFIFYLGLVWKLLSRSGSLPVCNACPAPAICRCDIIPGHALSQAKPSEAQRLPVSYLLKNHSAPRKSPLVLSSAHRGSKVSFSTLVWHNQNFYLGGRNAEWWRIPVGGRQGGN